MASKSLASSALLLNLLFFTMVSSTPCSPPPPPKTPQYSSPNPPPPPPKTPQYSSPNPPPPPPKTPQYSSPNLPPPPLPKTPQYSSPNPPPPPPKTPQCSPPVPKTPTSPNHSNGKCPFDILKLGVCANLLGLVNVQIGKLPTLPCCDLIKDLVDLELAACLCTAIKANILGINLKVPVALSAILNNCGRDNSAFECP